MFRKITGIILACLLVLSMSTVAMIPTAAATSAGNIVLNDGTKYAYQVGDVVEYKVTLEAAELVEGVQGTLYYDSSVLSLSAVDGYDACPNLGEVVFNSDDPDMVKFNSIRLSGFNFKTAKDLLKLSFTVIGEGDTNLNLVIEEMYSVDDAVTYFSKSNAVDTSGLKLVYSLTGNTEDVPVSGENTILLNDGTKYEYKLGDVVNYTVTLKASELFEDIEGMVYYDSSVLQLNRLSDEVEEPYEFCPNLGEAEFNGDMTDEARFNSIRLRGFDFTSAKELLKLSFTVVGEGETEIKLVIKEMTLKGNTGSYFTKSEQVIFDGIEITYSLTGNTEPVAGENTILLNDGTKYEYKLGDVVNYTVTLKAAELFEDIEGMVYYDSSVLQLNRLSDEVEEPYEFCPNLGEAEFNGDMTDEARFNSIRLRGFDFTSAKELLKLSFTVVGEGETEIKLVIKEMTLKGNTGSYFTKSEQVIFDGIEITYSLTGNTEDVPENEDNNIVLGDGEKYEYQLGDVINYTISLKAAELFEDIEGIIRYDSKVLSLNRAENSDDEAYEFFPNLGDAIINADLEDEIRFNSVKISGFDFKDGKELVNLTFTVIGEGETNIDLEIIEMTIKGNEDSYYTDGVQVKAEGLEMGYALSGNTKPPVIITKTVLMGDADQNGKVNVKDATLIQKYVAEVDTISEDGLLSADANEDTKVNVKDATAIQKYTARIDAENRIGETVTFTIVQEAV